MVEPVSARAIARDAMRVTLSVAWQEEAEYGGQG